MNSRTLDTLKELNRISELERTRAVFVPRGQLMSAITWDTGQLLNILLRSIGAKSILEVGTSVGFSTIWMAEAISETGGSLMTIEADLKKVGRAIENFHDAGLSNKVEILVGQAIDILTNMASSDKHNFDFVLIDADKENISKYFELSLSMVRKGGLIVVDNMMYPKKFTPIMDKFAQELRQNPSVRTVTVPIGNGEEIIIKL